MMGGGGGEKGREKESFSRLPGKMWERRKRPRPRFLMTSSEKLWDKKRRERGGRKEKTLRIGKKKGLLFLKLFDVWKAGQEGEKEKKEKGKGTMTMFFTGCSKMERGGKGPS